MACDARDTFLWCMVAIYQFAFSSVYIQIPGLWGENGILPARAELQPEPSTWSEFVAQPSLLRFGRRLLGLSPQLSMELTALAGVVLTIGCLVWPACRRSPVSFFLLWLLYLSIYQVGGTFLYFQWDSLLLETGLLSIILAASPTPHHGIALWLIKWLLFRLMFASGVVKLQSDCPLWWGLSALDTHYESQCIPTPLAWYFLNWVPSPWFNKLSTALVLVFEIPVPFLFFSPIRSLRMFAFYAQILLQVMIIFTGNYNFFNLLTIALCVTLPGDRWCDKESGCSSSATRKKSLPTAVVSMIRKLVATCVILGLIALTVKYFGIRPGKGWSLVSHTKFSRSELDDFVRVATPAGIWIGAFELAVVIATALSRSVSLKAGWFAKVKSLASGLIVAFVAVGMFSISLVPYTYIDRDAHVSLPAKFRELKELSDPLQAVHSYGLFRRMTGADGRPEVVVYGSDDGATWTEYEFLYKPGSVSRAPPFVAPHQPRLDWQMWFAALGTYQHNPWFLHFCYRLLTGEPTVLDLIDRNPFVGAPPRYIKATLFTYHYPKPSAQSRNWWVRTAVSEYLPPITKDDPGLHEYLLKGGILQATENGVDRGLVAGFLVWLRSLLRHVGGFAFLATTFVGSVQIGFLLRKGAGLIR